MRNLSLRKQPGQGRWSRSGAPNGMGKITSGIVKCICLHFPKSLAWATSQERTEKMTRTRKQPKRMEAMKSQESNPPEDHPDPDADQGQGLSLFGRVLKGVYEITFVVVVVVIGAAAGTLMGVLMPVGFPLLILWNRYVKHGNRKPLHQSN